MKIPIGYGSLFTAVNKEVSKAAIAALAVTAFSTYGKIKPHVEKVINKK